MEDKKVELKPCPFCGKGQSQVGIITDEYGSSQIFCGACGSSSGIHKDKEKVVNHWNKRPHEKE